MNRTVSMLAVAGAFAFTGWTLNATPASWFNANIDQYTVGALPLDKASGGNWVGTAAQLADKAEVAVAGKVAVDTDAGAALEFAAANAKTVGAGADNVVISSTAKFEPFTALPEVPADAKAGIILVKDATGDDYTFYVLGTASEAKAWVSSGVAVVAANVGNEFEISIKALKGTASGTLDLVYTIGSTEVNATVAASSGEFTKVCASGYGTLSALSSEYEGQVLDYTIATADFAANNIKSVKVMQGETELTADANGKYQVPYGADIVITLTAADDYRFGATNTKTINKNITAAGTFSFTDEAATATQGIIRIGDSFYETFIAARNAAVDGDTIKFIQDVETDGFYFPSTDTIKFNTTGLTINLNGKKLILTSNKAKSGVDYGIGLYMGSINSEYFTDNHNKFTFVGGEIAVKNTEANVCELIRNFGADVTFDGVKINGANLVEATTDKKDSYVVRFNGGNTTVTGTTQIISPTAGGYAFLIGNHANSKYPAPVVTINTTGTISGDVALCGGTLTATGDALKGDRKWYYGRRSCTAFDASTVSVEGVTLAAGAGNAIPASGNTGVCGQIFSTVAGALAAVEKDKVVTLFADAELDSLDGVTKDITVDANGYVLSFANAAMALTNNVTVICSGTTAGKGVLNNAQITIDADKTLDLKALSWGLGLIPADPTTAAFTLNEGASIKMGMADTWDDSFTNIVSVASGCKLGLVKADGVATISADPLATPTFSVTAGENSSISEIMINGKVVAEAPAKLTEGQTYKVTFTANSGYKFASTAQTVFEGTAATEAITIEGPDADPLATPTFSVTAGANSTAAVEINGAVVSPVPSTITEGQTYKVTFTANDGYAFEAGATTVFQGTAATETITITGPDASATATPVVPGTESPEITADSPAAAEAKVVIAPQDATAAGITTEADLTAYQAMFTKTATEVQGKPGTYKVDVAFNTENATVQAVQADVTAKTAAIDLQKVAAGTESSVTLDTSVKGLYYILESAAALGDITPTAEKLGDGTAISFEIPNKGATGFYRIKVSATSSTVQE